MKRRRFLQLLGAAPAAPLLKHVPMPMPTIPAQVVTPSVLMPSTDALVASGGWCTTVGAAVRFRSTLTRPDPDPTNPSPGMHLWGWMSPTELDWLHDQASGMTGNVVEIGSLHGRSSWALGLGCPGQVYCVDPWNDEGWDSWSRSLSLLENVHGIREPSPAAGVHVPDPIDMVFIDGAHDEASVRADIEYWEPRAGASGAGWTSMTRMTRP